MTASFLQKHRILLAALLLLLPAASRPAALGQDFPTFEQGAARLRAATVTVRVTLPAAAASSTAREAEDAAGADSETEPAPARGPRVLVSSGVLLAGGRVVTFVSATGDARIRITLPNGEQAEARPRVVDNFSGLTLLQIGETRPDGIELAEKVPLVGAWVLSAAGWGAEDAVLSFGILSGNDRSLRGAAFPPLLQCDLRTAVSSGGAGLVDRDGRLIGIVVGTDKEGERGGWTYAVDVSHVRRLLRAERGEKVVILRRRRPVLGLILGAGAEPGEVVVQRVTPGGPADQAGVRQGDQVLAADGLNIRSVYQAVVPLLKKQPGDSMALLLEQADGRRSIEVTLGGGVELPGPHFTGPLGLADPRIEVAQVGRNRFDVRDRRGGVRNLSVETQDAPPTLEQRQVRLLEKALDRYGVLIERYRQELGRRDREQAESRRVIDALHAEITELRRELSETPRPPAQPEQ